MSTATAATAASESLYALDGDELLVNFHQGQLRAWRSQARFVVLQSGTQGGKTSFGPIWLLREMQQCGPGDYIITTPTYQLLEKKALPEFRSLFESSMQLGRYTGSPSRKFVLSPQGQQRLFAGNGRDYETTVWFGYTANAESLEAATAKAVWNDEAGQPLFKRESFEALRRRTSIHRGRHLFTTTPYYHGWFKRRFWDQRHSDPDVDVIAFPSIANPAFPKEEFEQMRREMPAWRFDMFYRGLYTRPAGRIFDRFDRERHVIEPIELADDWPRYAGIDFGGVNTAAVFLAHDRESDIWYLYREYFDGRKTSEQHAQSIQAGEPRLTAYGGARSEGQWRLEFRAGGLHIYEPLVSDVEVGISRVYKMIALDKLLIFDGCEGIIDQLESYSRPLDEDGNALEGIEGKSSYHFNDALRYIASYAARHYDRGGIYV